MGFFSDLKDDLSQAVNELMPEEGGQEEVSGMAQDDLMPETSQAVNSFDTDLSQMLDKVEEEMGIEAPIQEPVYTAPAQHWSPSCRCLPWNTAA